MFSDPSLFPNRDKSPEGTNLACGGIATSSTTGGCQSPLPSNLFLTVALAFEAMCFAFALLFSP
jgi:hypothetical protein